VSTASTASTALGCWDAGVVGLGYTGLSLVIALAHECIPVTGFDIDPAIVEELTAGRSHVLDVDDRELADVAAHTFFTVDERALASRDVLFVCVPTPLRNGDEPDLSHVENAARILAGVLRPGQVVIIESTIHPGATEEVVLPILERSGLVLDRDFLLAHAPERLDPGNPSYRLGDITRVVGGASAASTAAAMAVYRRFVAKVHPVADARTAEMAKLLENSFRFVNIALANEMADLARHLGVDSWEVLEAAATKPFGFLPFNPGPGVGGHCIAVDPYYLIWSARQAGATPALLDQAGRVNRRMPQVVADLVGEALAERATPVDGARILVVGVAYKADVADVRNSPALECVRLLTGAGADVAYADAHVPLIRQPGLSLDAVPLTAERLAASDCVLVLCDHAAVNYQAVFRHGRLVVDARGALARRGLRGSHVRNL
jgi:UDP-N-acetyl-D-glucosamine dehydrogenase